MFEKYDFFKNLANFGLWVLPSVQRAPKNPPKNVEKSGFYCIFFHQKLCSHISSYTVCCTDMRHTSKTRGTFKNSVL